MFMPLLTLELVVYIPRQVAPQARIPLVKLQARKKGGPIVDVCIGSKESVRNSRLIGAYMNLNPRVRYIC